MGIFVPCIYIDYYRPQMKFVKVMFLHMSVILSTGGVCLSACWDIPAIRHPPRSRLPRTRHPPPQYQAPLTPGPGTQLEPGIPQGQAAPLGSRTHPGTSYPPEQCMLRDMVNERALCILLECNLVSGLIPN